MFINFAEVFPICKNIAFRMASWIRHLLEFHVPNKVLPIDSRPTGRVGVTERRRNIVRVQKSILRCSVSSFCVWWSTFTQFLSGFEICFMTQFIMTWLCFCFIRGNLSTEEASSPLVKRLDFPFHQMGGIKKFYSE